VREVLEIAIPVAGLAILLMASRNSKARWIRRPVAMPLRFWGIVAICLIAFAIVAHYI
jgi:hypothetical protein